MSVRCTPGVGAPANRVIGMAILGQQRSVWFLTAKGEGPDNAACRGPLGRIPVSPSTGGEAGRYFQRCLGANG
jgi:hypothetical protein